MDRQGGTERTDVTSGDEEMVRDGHLVIEESIGRREGLVEYEGTTEGTTATTGRTTEATGEQVIVESEARPVETVTTTTTTTTGDEGGLLGGGAMQAGATILGGLGSTALVDDATTGSGTTTGGADSLSMSSDNTADAATTGGQMALVQEGMRVVDAGGNEIGTVETVKMGDPAAMSTFGEEAGGAQSVLDDAGGLFGGGGGVDADVPEPFRAELMRAGFVRIDGKGLFGADRYASAEQIAGVSGDTVRLSVTKDALPGT